MMQQTAIELAHDLVERDGQVWVSSRDVAGRFEKRHDNVLRLIMRQMVDVPEDFNRLNFELVEYVDAKGQNRPEIMMTKNGFAFVVMGFTGREASAFKVAYIKAFDSMQELISGDIRRDEALRDLEERLAYTRRLLTLQASESGRSLHRRRMQVEAERRWNAKDQMRLPFAEELRCALLHMDVDHPPEELTEGEDL